MTSRLVALCFDAHDPRRLAGFWARALRWDVDDDAGGGARLVPTDGTRFSIRFLPVAEPKAGKNRIHLDLTTASLDDQEESVRLLLELGGRHVDVGQAPDDGHVVLADPEGNELCIIEPTNQFLAGCGRLGSITCDGPPEVGAFWSQALGWPLVWDQDEETAVRDPDGTGPFITWGPPVEPKTTRNRLHLELAPADGGPGALRAELDRLRALGATSTGDGRFLLDPGGNEFRIVG